ncbi:hypothetical protein Golomagni_00042 [Golovinomyces magnicellulatus]|nr:hypothetical protein Golomagni_00042 [Golovinomyces magnicellulatus]
MFIKRSILVTARRAFVSPVISPVVLPLPKRRDAPPTATKDFEINNKIKKFEGLETRLLN